MASCSDSPDPSSSCPFCNSSRRSTSGVQQRFERRWQGSCCLKFESHHSHSSSTPSGGCCSSARCLCRTHREANTKRTPFKFLGASSCSLEEEVTHDGVVPDRGEWIRDASVRRHCSIARSQEGTERKGQKTRRGSPLVCTPPLARVVRARREGRCKGEARARKHQASPGSSGHDRTGPHNESVCTDKTRSKHKERERERSDELGIKLDTFPTPAHVATRRRPANRARRRRRRRDGSRLLSSLLVHHRGKQSREQRTPR